MDAIIVILVCTVFAIGVYEVSMALVDAIRYAINWIVERVRG